MDNNITTCKHTINPEVLLHEFTKPKSETSSCGTLYIHGRCEEGHEFLKLIFCGKEWCPVCGAKNSPDHLRRFSRWVDKARHFDYQNYIVFTIPESLRHNYRTKKSLSYLYHELIRTPSKVREPGLLWKYGIKRGLIRMHWFGSKSKKYNPHLNVLCDAGGYITEKTRENIKREWSNIVGYKYKNIIVDFSYNKPDNIPGKLHDLKYVTRATFLNKSWDRQLAREIKGFKSMRTWGDWSDNKKWSLHDTSFFDVGETFTLEKGCCPKCGHKLKWGHVLPTYLLDLERYDYKEYKSGYFFVIPTFSIDSS